MQVTQAAAGQKAFFRTNNGGYGTEWDSKQGGVDPSDPTEVPKYAELVSLHCFFTPPVTRSIKWNNQFVACHICCILKLSSLIFVNERQI